MAALNSGDPRRLFRLQRYSWAVLCGWTLLSVVSLFWHLATHNSEVELELRPSEAAVVDDHHTRNTILGCALTWGAGLIGIAGATRILRLRLRELNRMEDALRESEARYRELFNRMTSCVAVYESRDGGRDFVFKDLNLAGQRLSRVYLEDIAGKSVQEVFPGVREMGLFEAFQRVWQSGVPEQHPISLYRDNRITQWVENQVYRLPSGEIVAVYEDVTEARRAESELHQSRKMLAHILDSVPQSIFWKDGDGVYLGCNEVFARAAGIARPEDIAGKTDFDLPWPRAEAEAYRADDQEVIKSASPKLHIVEPLQQADGMRLWIDTTKVPLVNESGSVYGILGVFDNITERKGAEEAVRNEKMLSESIINSLPGVFYLFNENNRFLRWNKNFERISGYSSEEFTRLSPLDFFSGFDQEHIAKRIRIALEEGSADAEADLVSKDGTRTPHFFTGSRVVLDGKLCIIGTGVDISERKRAEEELRFRSNNQAALNALLALSLEPGSIERFLQNALELLTDLPWLSVESKGLIFLAEGNAQELVMKAQKGFDGEGGSPCIGIDFGECVCGRAALTQEAQYLDNLGGRHEKTYDGITPHGHYCVPIVSEGQTLGVICLFLKSGNPCEAHELAFLRMVADVLAGQILRKRAEVEAHRLVAAVEQAAEAVIITDASGRIQYVNPAFTRVTGFDRHEVLGENPRILKSGRQDRAFYKALWQTLTAGRVWSGHFVNKRKDGVIYEEECIISPLREGSAEITNYVALKRDVTRELELERQLRQSQKMEAIGTLAGGIAHDFNNILQSVLGYADLARSEVPPGSLAESCLREVTVAGERARELIARILAFSRKSDQERIPLRLQPLAAEAMKLLRGSLPSTIDIQCHLSETCGPVLADPTRIHQIIMNLCTNAYHAMRETGGILEVALSEVRVDTEWAAKCPDLYPETFARLTVSDSGCGMNEKVLKRIFEPYFTTREVGNGTGLGLSVVHGIVKELNGAILVESALGAGSRFDVFLPVCLKPVEASQVEQIPAAELVGSERVLLVDDEEALVRMASMALQQYGYEVETCTSSIEAQERFRSDPQRYDVVVTDQTMPHLTGLQLSQELLRLRPDLPILLCTGYSEVADAATVAAAGIREFIPKPFLPEILAQAIRRVLRNPC